MRVALLTLAMIFMAAEARTPASAMLERMRGLTGEWQGTLEWSGDRTGRDTLGARYSTTGNGSAVVEDLIMGGNVVMTSVYHLDGADLRMTHFCGARNQPRLKAAKIDEGNGTVDFAFVDATNIGPANPGHVEAARLHLIDAGHMTI